MVYPRGFQAFQLEHFNWNMPWQIESSIRSSWRRSLRAELVCAEISDMALADPHLPVHSIAANPSYCGRLDLF